LEITGVNRAGELAVLASAGEKFSWPVRVYYEDTDALGMVYHANYLKYLERARVEWLQAIGIALPELAQRDRTAFVVRRLAIEYLKPARLGERLEATVRVEMVRGCSADLLQTIEAANGVFATARVQLAYIDIDKLKPAAMSDDIRYKLKPVRSM